MWQNWDLNPGSLTVGSVSLAKACSASRKAKGAGPRLKSFMVTIISHDYQKLYDISRNFLQKKKRA